VRLAKHPLSPAALAFLAMARQHMKPPRAKQMKTAPEGAVFQKKTAPEAPKPAHSSTKASSRFDFTAGSSTITSSMQRQPAGSRRSDA
jgi:hypothetical protein